MANLGWFDEDAHSGAWFDVEAVNKGWFDKDELATTGFSLSVDSGVYASTGTVAALRATRIFPVDSGVYAQTGTNATLRVTLAAVTTSYAISGVAAELRATRIFAVDPGSYALTGTTAGLRRAAYLDAVVGSYLIDGEAGGGTNLTSSGSSANNHLLACMGLGG